MTGIAQQSPRTPDAALGLLIRERRRGIRLSQTDLAEAVGVTFQQIQKYERGRNRVSFSRLVVIAHALDCSASELVGNLDGAAEPSPVLCEQLGTSGAAALLMAYARVPEALKSAILELILEIARDKTQS